MGRVRNKNWGKSETLLLIRVWKNHYNALRKVKRNRVVYNRMQLALLRLGVTRNVDEVRARVKTLIKLYRNAKATEVPLSFRAYFDEIHKFIDQQPEDSAEFGEAVEIKVEPDAFEGLEDFEDTTVDGGTEDLTESFLNGAYNNLSEESNNEAAVYNESVENVDDSDAADFATSFMDSSVVSENLKQTNRSIKSNIAQSLLDAVAKQVESSKRLASAVLEFLDSTTAMQERLIEALQQRTSTNGTFPLPPVLPQTTETSSPLPHRTSKDFR